MNRITINDIARIANVSKSTVSEVINKNGSGKVRASTCAKIQAIIEKYNYVPSMQARALSTHQTYQIGFLVSSTATLELANNYFGMILAGVEHQCAAQDYRCLVSRYDLGTLTNFVLSKKLHSRCIDGLIITGLKEDPLHLLDHLEIPILLIGESVNPGLFQLHNDMFQTLVNAVKYLRDLGHRHILLPYTFPQELALLVQVLNHCNKNLSSGSPDYLTGHYHCDCHDSNEFIHGRNLAESVFSTPENACCTALLANDQICGGFMQVLHEHGYVLPRDYSILATNDSTLMEWGIVPVTVCDNGAFNLGEKACSLLISYLKKELTEEAFRESLRSWNKASSLVRRASCSFPRASELIRPE